MRHIILDECLPVKLKYRVSELSDDFKVTTVSDLNWTGFKNGDLFSKAQLKFDVLSHINYCI